MVIDILDFNHIEEKKEIWLPEVNSCTTDKRVAKVYAKVPKNKVEQQLGVLMIFEKPKVVIPILDCSNYPNEKEILVSGGKTFKITSIEKDKKLFVIKLRDPES